MGEIEIFQFPATGQTVRTLIRDGEPWFVAVDVCAFLGGRPQDSTRHLDDDEKGMCLLDTPSGQQQMLIVNEAGLYSLIHCSRTPEAKAFRRWITHDVLPAFRMTSRYQLLAVPDLLAELERQNKLTARAIELAKAERVRAAAAAERAAELEPDAARAQRTLDATGLALVGTVAKQFGMQERVLREFLYSEGMLIRDGARRNEPMARYVRSGHFKVKVRPVSVNPDRPPVEKSTTYVTPKGAALIWRRLHAAGHVSSPCPSSGQLQLSWA